jgi:hypothetical protein
MPLTDIREQTITKYPWDILIILDACRYDFFERYNTISGQLTKMWTPTSSTYDYMILNFPHYYRTTTYVSANPFINSRKNLQGFKALSHFPKVIDVWDFGWNEDLKTVPPENVTDAAIPYLGDKRLIIHYMQPHTPYIGENRYPPADNLNWKSWRLDALSPVHTAGGLLEYTKSVDLGGSFTIGHRTLPQIIPEIAAELTTAVFTTPLEEENKFMFQLETRTQRTLEKSKVGERYSSLVDPALLSQWELAYRDNLLLAIRAVERLIPHIPANRKTIITSDHGEFLGEEGKGFHPSGFRHPVLNLVPWLEVSAEIPRLEDRI